MTAQSEQLPHLANQSVIPPIFHFVWYGHTFPEFAVIAIASALDKNPGYQAILWHDGLLAISAPLRRLQRQGLELRVIEIEGLLAQAESASASARFVLELAEIYGALESPAARANLVRLLVLQAYGGIYLDTDTLTLKNMDPLRELGAFCGRERVLWPTGRSKIHLGALALDALRWICGRVSGGAWVHKHFLSFYTQAANNAVLGFRRGHPFCERLLVAATEIPREERLRRYRFGTHLLQKELAAGKQDVSAPDHVFELPPNYFFPQGPVVSLHYFRPTRNINTSLAVLISDETHVIHWYGSLAELSRRDSSHVFAHQDREVFSHLCARYLGLFDPE